MVWIGAKYGRDRRNYYIQSDNPTEGAMQVYGKHGWLKSCGPTAMINCLAAVGHDVSMPKVGNYQLQPEEIVMDYMNDPRNAAKFRVIRDIGDAEKVHAENEIPQYYPNAAAELFGATAKYTYLTIEKLGAIIRDENVAVQISTGGHYVAVVGVSYQITGKNKLGVDPAYFMFNDPWPEQYKDDEYSDGFNRVITAKELGEKHQVYSVVYYPPFPKPRRDHMGIPT